MVETVDVQDPDPETIDIMIITMTNLLGLHRIIVEMIIMNGKTETEIAIEGKITILNEFSKNFMLFFIGIDMIDVIMIITVENTVQITTKVMRAIVEIISAVNRIINSSYEASQVTSPKQT